MVKKKKHIRALSLMSDICEYFSVEILRNTSSCNMGLHGIAHPELTFTDVDFYILAVCTNANPI